MSAAFWIALGTTGVLLAAYVASLQVLVRQLKELCLSLYEAAGIDPPEAVERALRRRP